MYSAQNILFNKISFSLFLERAAYNRVNGERANFIRMAYPRCVSWKARYFRFEKQRESRTSSFRLIDTYVRLIQEGTSKRGQNNTLLLVSKHGEGRRKISLARLFRHFSS